MKRFQLHLSALAVLLACLIAACGHLLLSLLLLTLVACALNPPRPRLCAVTLSVPEILKDILAAFKTQTPELFGPSGFAQDFTSDTARLGDKIIAHIDHLPVTAAYDNTAGPGHGFYMGAQDVATLIEDVPVTLTQLRHVPVKVSFLTGLATKGVPLYKAAVANIGFALGKFCVDQVLTTAVTGAVSNSVVMGQAFTSLDSMEGTLRAQCNYQKLANDGRWCILNSTLAGALANDDRVKSKLFYGQLNGQDGIRRWQNLAGFGWVREYPDFPAGGINAAGLAGDRRLAVVAVRKLRDMNETARALGIREVMKFYPLRDEDSGLELSGISWQEAGTGDLYASAAVLFGAGVGNQGGGAGSMTDSAGLVIRTQ